MKKQSQETPAAKKELANWATLDEQHKTTFQRDYVACHEPYERNWLVENVLLAFPNYRKSAVEKAIQEVCTSLNITPRKRTEFLELLQQRLENNRPLVAAKMKKKN